MIRSSFKFALEKLLVIDKAVEIGVDRGVNAVDMLEAGVNKLFLIDQYKAFDAVSQLGEIPFTQNDMDLAKAEMLSKIEKYVGKVKFFEMSSLEASRLFDNESIDYVYIDAVHKYNEVKADISYWFPKVRKGGILAGHDYKNCHCKAGARTGHSDCGYTGLRKAVDEFAKANSLKLYTSLDFGIYEEDWWVIK